MSKSTENRTVEISFEYASESDLSPKTTIYNALILIPSLSDQIVRYGLHKTSAKSEIMVGLLQGGRESFTAMIHSYGFKVQVASLPRPIA